MQTTLATKKAERYKAGEPALLLASNCSTILCQVQGICKTLRLASTEQCLAAHDLKRQRSNRLEDSGIDILLNCVGNLLKEVARCSIAQAREVLHEALDSSVTPLPSLSSWPCPAPKLPKSLNSSLPSVPLT